MDTKEELKTLRELARIYQDCPERVATYNRWRWSLFVVGVILIFAAFFLSSFEGVSSRLCLVIALLSGGVVGLSFLCSVSAKQMPLLVRYSTLHKEEVQKRLEELKDAS